MKAESYVVRGYVPTIGIECHVQLKTKTKLFAGIDNDAREASPNTLISHICLGLPGALPVLNKRAVYLSCRAAFALNTKPNAFSKFDRKHYFYPDLPNGYQITQYDEPIISGGSVTFEVDGVPKTIHITRAHLEADAGKSTHPEGADYSLVDLNRAGTPLLEIVSEPEIHSPDEAKAYARELSLLMRYADVSYANLFYGNMRFDVNVSVSKTKGELGIRTETKNLNSFKAVQGAVEFEIQRQISLLERGEEVVQETRGWDDAKQKTFSQRSKEDAHDYRYFPDPDLPPIRLTDSFVKDVQSAMPLMPGELRGKLQKLDLDTSVIETLLDEMPAGKLMAEVLASTDSSNARRIAHLLAIDIQGFLSETGHSWDDISLNAESLVAISQMIASNELSSTAAKQLGSIIAIHGGSPREVAKEHDLLQVSGETELIPIIQEVIHAHQKAVDDILAGEEKAIGFLVGQVMKQTKGKANPAIVQNLIRLQIKDGK